jgi:hypothetical protein
MPPGIADTPLILLGHLPLIAAVARVPVGARVVRPVHDAAEVGDEATQDGAPHACVNNSR